jgi:hypothetical protein
MSTTLQCKLSFWTKVSKIPGAGPLHYTIDEKSHPHDIEFHPRGSEVD